MPQSPKSDRSISDSNEMTNFTPMQKAQLIWDSISVDDGRFFAPLIKRSMRLVDASQDGPNHGKLVVEFDNEWHWANNSDNLHGGVQSVIYDICTSLVSSLIARPGYWTSGGVSRVLSVTYIRPAPAGEALVIEAEVVHAGQRLAVMKGAMKRKRDGALVSICEHNKVNTDPPVGGKL